MKIITLGKTNLKVNKNGFGALPIQRISEKEAVYLLHKAFDNGINFYDTARFYTDSEEKIGAAFGDRRSKVLIASKTAATSIDNYLELSYGQTREWGRLKYGIRVKPLIGLGHGRFRGRDVTLNAAGKGWTQDVHADIEIAGGLVTWSTPADNDSRLIDVASLGINRYKIGFGGLGLALDLGAEYPLTENLTLSASVLDAGGIKWLDKVYGKSDSYYKYDPNEDIDSEDKLQPLIDILDATNFHIQDKKANSFEVLPVSLNVGAKYKMPFNEDFSAAILYTYKPYRFYGYNEVRLFGCWTPLSWLSLDLSGARHNFGWSFGGAFDVHAPGFNVFWGIDSYSFRVTPQMIPIDKSNIGMTFGVSFPI